MSKNQAFIMAVLGASGSGKSTSVKRMLNPKPARLMVFDTMREYAHVGMVFTEIGPMIDAIAKQRRFAVVFQPSSDPKVREKQFSMFCAIALVAGNLTMIVEELRFLTTPSRAPLKWAEVTLTGRHKGLRVIGTSQRPASIDKDFLGNCTRIRTGRLVYPEDRRAVAKAMQVDENELATLQNLQWIETSEAGRSSGTLKF